MFSSNYHEPHHKKKPRFFVHHRYFWKIVFIVLFCLGLLHFCSKSNNAKKPAALPVVLGRAHSANVPVYLSGLGTVTPKYSVTVRSQVSGQLLQVFYQEGQIVKAGDVLAQIDPRPFQALLMQYQGQLKRDQAILANAQSDLLRYQNLWRENSVSKQILDTQASVVNQDAASVQVDEGLIAATNLNILYSRVTAPIAGRIGLRLVDPGNYVQTTDATGLAVINSMQPMTVISTLPEGDVSAVMTELRAGKTLTMLAFDRTDTQVLATGKLLTLDNQIDPTTGTVRLRSEFQNENNQLFPSEFVNTKLLIKTLKNVTVVPTAAIQYGAKGAYIYVVNEADAANMVVTNQVVTVGVVSGDDTVITQGIKSQAAVVTEGADKLTDGAKVYVAGTKALGTAGTKNARHSAA